MMMAIPEDKWRVFSRRGPAEMVATLRALAQKVRLKAYRKSPRGPKKPRRKGEGTSKTPQVSTAMGRYIALGGAGQRHGAQCCHMFSHTLPTWPTARVRPRLGGARIAQA
jgi:hypothetical protein